MKAAEFIKQYWHHYLILEKDFIETFRYVDLDNRNYKAFSLEYQRLLLAIGSELDVTFKLLCSFPGSERKTINDYQQKIKEDKLMSLDNEVEILQLSSKIIPFRKGLENEIPPTWWTSYNKVKHNRTENMEEANLENVLYALAGLYLLEGYCYRNFRINSEIDYLSPESKLFKLAWERQYSSPKHLTLKNVDFVHTT